MAWTPDYLAAYQRRFKLIEAARDQNLRETLLIHYKNNPIDWINDWVTTYDPRKIPAYVPMVLFQRQKEFIQFLVECWKDKQAGLVEKSRDVGASWLCCGFAVWLMIFQPGSSAGFGSRIEEDVDTIGDPDSLFEKMRIIIKNLPKFMLPSRVDTSSLKIINADTGANITGGGGDNIGRGGRSSIFFKDESAHYDHAEKIEAALSENSDVQIDISTVNGSGNVFYRKRMAGLIWKPGEILPRGKTRVFVFDWRDNPMKDQAWYDEKRAQWEGNGMLHVFAQEVDRDYSASVAGIIIQAKWVKAAIDAHIRLGIQDDGERMAGLDVADNDGKGDKNSIAVRRGIVLRHCSAWGEGDTGVTARRAIGVCHETGTGILQYDCIGVGSGVKAETNRMINEDGLTLKVIPFNAGLPPQDPEGRVIPNDENSPENGDYFLNLKAQAWLSLANRFEKTYKMVTQGITFPHDELISIDSTIPDLHELEIELSQAIRKYNGKGKMMVDKSPGSKKSPNRADGVVICYNPWRELSGFDVMV